MAGFRTFGGSRGLGEGESIEWGGGLQRLSDDGFEWMVQCV